MRIHSTCKVPHGTGVWRTIERRTNFKGNEDLPPASEHLAFPRSRSNFRQSGS
jgi:hypothetical protein